MMPARPELIGSFGMVASTHWIASGAGMSMLERGGNAYDAAVAAGLVLQVIEPHLNGIGGEVPILHWSAAHGSVEVVCGQGPAPQAATIPAFRELGLDFVPGTGLLAACVPGAFAAWTRLLEEHGSLELSEVMEPAIFYATRGYPVSPRLHDTVASVEPIFRNDWPSSAAYWCASGGPPRAGSLQRNPAFGRTFSRLLEAARAGHSREQRIALARDAFYRGFVAESIARFCQRERILDSSGRRHSGLLTATDLASFEATVEPALSYNYAGKTIYKPSTWTQGLVMLQQLAILAHLDVGEVHRATGQFAHLVVEAAKLAFADREAWYGDPDFVDVPVGGLLDASYNRARAELVSDEASYDLRPGSPFGCPPPSMPDEIAASGSALDGRAGVGEPGQANPGAPPHGDTAHLDVADRWGNVVTAMPSGGWLQSSPYIPELGFCLGTRAQMFWLAEGLPASLEGGKRPRSTLSPGLASDDYGPWLAFGSPGGDNQDQWSLIFLLTVIHQGLDLQQAIDLPTFHTKHFPESFFPRQSRPGSLFIEGHAASAAIADLRTRGHDVTVDPPWSQSWLSAVGRGTEDGLLRGAANARDRHGYVVGR